MQYSFDGEYCEMAGGDMNTTYNSFTEEPILRNNAAFTVVVVTRLNML